ncbi:MAG TPA: MBL fold metallo-hydrolase RNA specificity domain-containing protein, partial [Nitrosopumilaceae archaeon]|nr:MBL fold metallo-hydrolase RNA specificity domain-containing protein [Nitrosopumilaceae archaeon]
ANVLDVFEHNLSWHKLSMHDCREMCKDIQQISSIQETYKLAKSDHPKIIIAGSGMASGGRVLTYFAQYLGNPLATILLVGFQAEGTRGRALLEGAKEVKLYGKYFLVKAEIKNIEGLSAHADQHELIGWLSKLDSRPTEIFIVHGEPDSAKALKDKIRETYHWESAIPNLNQTVSI